ncbi:MAG: glycosyltransferase [Oliverpabstia sp.]|nr:glycosyltransferase [Oliverpabstia sp.]
MSDTKIALVVLHYQAMEDTIKCVESIKNKIGIEEYKIIIVDNASPDQSGRVLQKKYQSDKKIVVILSEENLGFAKGNNLGYMWAKKHFSPNFIVLSNNDIVLITDNFYQKIEREYSSFEFGVLGPLILNADGKFDSNPITLARVSKKEILYQINDAHFHRNLNRYGLLNLYNTASVIKHVLKRKPRKMTNSLEYHEGCTLHGAFLIFSPLFIRKRDGLNPNTFMYKEEYILHAEMEKMKMKIVYSPELCVFHKEDASTDSVVKKTKEKWEFIYSNIIKSSQVLLDVYNQLNLS